MNLYQVSNSSEDPEGYGGAITLRNSARLTVVNVGFRNNSARYGGAIAALDISILKVFESRFFANRAEVKAAQSGAAAVVRTSTTIASVATLGWFANANIFGDRYYSAHRRPLQLMQRTRVQLLL